MYVLFSNPWSAIDSFNILVSRSTPRPNHLSSKPPEPHTLPHQFRQAALRLGLGQRLAPAPPQRKPEVPLVWKCQPSLGERSPLLCLHWCLLELEYCFEFSAHVNFFGFWKSHHHVVSRFFQNSRVLDSVDFSCATRLLAAFYFCLSPNYSFSDLACKSHSFGNYLTYQGCHWISWISVDISCASPWMYCEFITSWAIAM